MNRIASLDGLRGLAALWVLVGHSLSLTGNTIPSFARPAFGVDLFILLSGFLMTLQFQVRRERENWSKPAIWIAFWIRRFFRIAPLYFILLFAALLLGSWIYECRMLIDLSFDRTPQLAQRYLDISLANWLTHLTFTFGLIPEYAFRTPLPDWSIGLEMQFYAVFPFLVLVAQRISWIGMAAVFALLAAIIAIALSVAGIDFPMPSFLPLKLHVFLAGILISVALEHSGRNVIVLYVLALVLITLPIGPHQYLKAAFVRIALVTGFFALIHWDENFFVGLGARFMGSSFMHWMGELSYGVYLIHLLVLTPLSAAYLMAFGTEGSSLQRFAIVFGGTAVISYSLAFVGYHLVELRGQKLGRAVVKHMGLSTKLASTPAETKAAP